MAWFALECHYTPDEVYDMPWTSLVQLTLVSDDIIARRWADQHRTEQPERYTRAF